MKFEHVRVMNLENAFRGMRHPKESYHLSDSAFGFGNFRNTAVNFEIARKWADFIISSADEESNPEIIKKIMDKTEPWLMKNGVIQACENGEGFEYAFLGPKDLRLAQQLIRGGSEHRKFMRQIFVSVDITAPLYW